MNKAVWKSTSSNNQKPWGEETSWHALGRVDGKIIKMNSGHRTSFKYHRLKDEVLFVLSGELNVLYGSSTTIDDPVASPYKKVTLLPGEVLNVQSGCPYRLEAVTASEIVEISLGSKRDAVMLSDDYGRV